MKKITLFLAITLSSMVIFAQWEFQNPEPGNAVLNDIQFVDENNGWAVGEFGTILHTADGGVNWEEQNSSAGFQMGDYAFLSVCFIDLNNGWAVGSHYDGYIVAKTTNGGNLWTLGGCSDGGGFIDVVFTDPDNGWVIENSTEGDGSILHSENGGISWNGQYSIVGTYLRSLCFIDGENGWAVGDNGMILHTSNSGLNWVEQEGGTNIDLKGVCFTDTLNGWVIGYNYTYPHNPKILHTADGGANWAIIFNLPYYLAAYIDNIFFTDTDHGWVSCRSPYGAGWSIYSTTDGGVTWNGCDPSIISYSPFKLFFINPDTGWAVGENVILSSTNGGLDWELQNSVSNVNFKSVFFADQLNGWALGEKPEGTGEWNAVIDIVHTNDGGLNWQIDAGGYHNAGDMSFYSLFFIDQYYGWATGWGLGWYGNILKTSDGGLNWETIEIDYALGPIFFVDSLNGWGGGCNRIIHTTDGGYNWAQQYQTDEGYINSLIFIDQSEGWAVGSVPESKGLIVHTTDGGATWNEQLSGIYLPLNSVSFINHNSGWAVGDSGTIIRTSDGGQNWVLQDCPDKFSSWYLNSVCFTDGNKGWTAGSSNKMDWNTNGSVILQTIDGGETWQEQFYRPYSGLTSIQFTDADNGWAVGYGGTILHTNNGGATGFDENIIGSEESLIQCYPNPFSTSTTIKYELTQPSAIQLTIYDYLGKQVKVIEKKQAQGKQQITWNADGLPVGIYYCRLQSGDQMVTSIIIKM